MMQESHSNETSGSWFALKVFYNRVAMVENLVAADGKRHYVPKRSVERTVGNRTVRRMEPLIGSLLFVRADGPYVAELERRLNGKIMVYRRHGEDSREPAPIPDSEMEVFMLVTSAADRGLEPIDITGANCRCGDRVRVTGGIFAGAEGFVRRIGRDKRLVVSIEGVVAVATSYIPARYLEKID